MASFTPAINRWAIFGRPSGTDECATPEMSKLQSGSKLPHSKRCAAPCAIEDAKRLECAGLPALSVATKHFIRGRSVGSVVVCIWWTTAGASSRTQTSSLLYRGFPTRRSFGLIWAHRPSLLRRTSSKTVPTHGAAGSRHHWHARCVRSVRRLSESIRDTSLQKSEMRPARRDSFRLPVCHAPRRFRGCK